eukprot:1143450-Pelagomonas_calceolata.AAC.1
MGIWRVILPFLNEQQSEDCYPLVRGSLCSGQARAPPSQQPQSAGCNTCNQAKVLGDKNRGQHTDTRHAFKGIRVCARYISSMLQQSLKFLEHCNLPNPEFALNASHAVRLILVSVLSNNWSAEYRMQKAVSKSKSKPAPGLSRCSLACTRDHRSEGLRGTKGKRKKDHLNSKFCEPSP